MAIQKGRDMLLKLSDGEGVFLTVAGIRARTVSLNARAVDVTDSGSGGWRELLAGAGVRSMAVSGSGVFRDAASDARMREVFFGQVAEQWQIIVPGFGIFTGAFLITALEYAGQHDGEATFAVTLASAGEVAFAS